MRAEIDYGVATAQTSTGAIGLKVWVFKGEIVQKHEQQAAAIAAALAAPAAAPEKPASDRPARGAPGDAPGGDKPKRARRPSTAKPKSGAKNAATRKA